VSGKRAVALLACIFVIPLRAILGLIDQQL
jgi:hypothetical protein